MSVWLSGVPDAGWDDAIRQAQGHFLQSRAWQSVQAALGATVVHSRDPDWSWAGHTGGRFPLRYMYVPCGPTVINARAEGAAVSDMVSAARDLGATFIRFEPRGAVDLFTLIDRGAKEVRQVQPRFSWLLGLDDEMDVLRRGLTKGHRSSINQAERKGLHIRRATAPDEIEILIRLLAKTSQRSNFHSAGPRYFRTLATTLMPEGAACLYIAEADQEPVAAALGFDFNGVRHYAHAGADPEPARRLSAAAPLVWQMILDAKQDGMHTFDFWGVLPAAKPRHPWNGFTQFKKSFGGRLEERAGTWELPVRKWRHRVHALARAVHR